MKLVENSFKIDFNLGLLFRLLLSLLRLGLGEFGHRRSARELLWVDWRFILKGLGRWSLLIAYIEWLRLVETWYKPLVSLREIGWCLALRRKDIRLRSSVWRSLLKHAGELLLERGHWLLLIRLLSTTGQLRLEALE